MQYRSIETKEHNFNHLLNSGIEYLFSYCHQKTNNLINGPLSGIAYDISGHLTNNR